MLLHEAEYTNVFAKFTQYAKTAFNALREDRVKYELADQNTENYSDEFAYDRVDKMLSAEFNLYYPVLFNDTQVTADFLKSNATASDIILFQCFIKNLSPMDFIKKFDEYLDKMSTDEFG